MSLPPATGISEVVRQTGKVLRSVGPGARIDAEARLFDRRTSGADLRVGAV